MPIRVVLDTNVYTNDKLRRSEPFKSLGRLLKTGDLKLILPFIVMREFQTQLRASNSDDIANLLKSGRALIDRGIPDDLKTALQVLLLKFADRQEQVEGHAQSEFDHWLAENAVAQHGLSADLSKKAMEAYFTGQAPLVSPKDRKHIPDSFLYQALAELAAEGAVCFVSHDNQLREHCAKIVKVEVFESLTKFIAAEQVQSLIVEEEVSQSSDRASTSGSKKNVLKRLQHYAEINPHIKTYVAEHGAEMVAGTTFRSRSIPGNDQEAYVQMFGHLDDIELSWDEAVYMGDSTFVVPYAGTGEMLIEYYLNKADTWQVEDRHVSLTDHNNHVWEVQENCSVTIHGVLSIELDEDFESVLDIAEALQDLEIDSIESVCLEEDA
jgi:PIN domain